MRCFVRLACTLLVSSIVASAQSPTTPIPKMEIFGGYSYVSTDLLETPGVVPGGRGSLTRGWNAQFTFNASHNVGLVADFDGHYGSQDIPSFGKVNARLHSFLFGPKLTHHADKFEMYVHGLFGASHASIDIPGQPTSTAKQSDTDFALAVGGGVDYVASPHVAVRVMQGDYMMGQVFNSIENHIRLSTGVVLRF